MSGGGYLRRMALQSRPDGGGAAAEDSGWYEFGGDAVDFAYGVGDFVCGLFGWKD